MKRSLVPAWAGLFVAGVIQAAEPPAATPSPAPPPMVDPAAAVNGLLRETALALESKSIEPAEQPKFIDLLNAAEQLRGDKKLAPSERDRLRALARVRLRQAAEVLKKQTAQEANVAAKQPAAAPAALQIPAETTLAQQLQFQLPGGVGGQGFIAGANPQAAGPGAATGAAAELESAKQLMDVITSHIQPESWEDAGGRGVIRYWTLGHALVIRATSDVHDGTADLIEQLR